MPDNFRILPAIATAPLAAATGLAQPAVAQVVPNSTLPTNSQVTSSDNTLLIEGGTKRDGNLFHSFKSFSVPEGKRALFNNASGIDAIFTRVTGSSRSQIDGTLATNGSADLYLLNPNGIVFGPNAKLDVGGSFVATTATSIKFADGTQFSARKPNSPSVTVSTPSGAIVKNNSGPIRVQGPGHQLDAKPRQPTSGRDPSLGLQVPNGETLALIGGDIQLDGGVLTAESGHLELGALRQGEASFDPSAWDFSYGSQFAQLELDHSSLLDVSGSPGGSIGVRARDATFAGNSVAFSQSQGDSAAGEVFMKVERSLTIEGDDPQAEIPGGIVSEALGSGSGSDVNLEVGSLNLTDANGILAQAQSSGDAGDIIITADRSVRMSGTNPDGLTFTTLSSITFGEGSSGKIRIEASDLEILGGANLGTSTSGPGPGGDLIIRAGELTVAGTGPLSFQGKKIRQPADVSTSAGASGNAGDVQIEADRVVARNGGQIRATTFASGSAGNLSVDASTIKVQGENGPFTSTLAASVRAASPGLRKLFRLPKPSEVTGDVGQVKLNADNVRVLDGGLIAAANEGQGVGGDIVMDVENLSLDSGRIEALAAQGDGGNIRIDSIVTLLRNGSAISAEAGGTGEGGNIRLDTKALVLLEGSQISANAEQGPGGNIQIDTQANFVSPDSEITASSEANVDGTVQIDTPDTNLAAQLQQFDSELLRAVRQLLACGAPGSAQAGRYRIGQSSMLPLAGSSNIARPELLSAPGGSAGGGGTNASASGASAPDSITSAIASCSGG